MCVIFEKEPHSQASQGGWAINFCEHFRSLYIMLPISTICRTPVTAIACVFIVPSSEEHENIFFLPHFRRSPENVTVNAN